MQRPKLRDNKGKQQFEIYPLGQVPDEFVRNIGKWLVYQYLIGSKDISGDVWGNVFAKAIGGIHLESPLGLSDVVFERQSWSTKTVKHLNPHTQKKVRIISGRCSPDYSYGITNPHEDVQKTGAAVLSIFNERINIAKESYASLRSAVLIRNFETFEFSIFENEIGRYVTSDFKWKLNKNGNLEGHDSNEKHCFTWQPHGSQFTIIYDVPPSAKHFSVKQPPILDFEKTLNQIGFDTNWVTIL